MKHNDYKIIEEEKIYAVFNDGDRKIQKVGISKDVANVLRTEQKYENAIVRANERHTVSLEQFNYEGELFAYQPC